MPCGGAEQLWFGCLHYNENLSSWSVGAVTEDSNVRKMISDC